jgi:tetratricopeptide (TPR) repeat protein
MSMTQIEMDPYPGQDGKYLYQKTDANPRQNQEAELLPCDESAESIQMSIKRSLTSKFPDMLSGEAFFEHSLKRVESWDHFDVMVIRPDPAEDGSSKNPLQNLESMPLLAEVVNKVCNIHSGHWGMVYIDCLACFLEIKDSSDVSEKIAEIIRKELKTRTQVTFSIGIATYPQLSYKKDDILENARKALSHAGLLGHDSKVRFDAVSLNISGDKLYQEGDVDNAIAEFEKALLIDQQNVNVLNSLGVCYSTKGEHQKALNEFMKVMALAPDDVMALYNAGLACLMIGDKHNALEMFLKAYALDENQFEVIIQLGRLYLETKGLELARKYLEKAVEMDLNSGPAHRFLGECYSELNMAKEAVNAYSKAVKLNANDAYSLSALACLYARQKINKEIAIVFAKQSVDLSPWTALFHHRLGEVYYLLDCPEEALKEFKSASELGHDCRSFILEIENRLLADKSLSRKQS